MTLKFVFKDSNPISKKTKLTKIDFYSYYYAVKWLMRQHIIFSGTFGTYRTVSSTEDSGEPAQMRSLTRASAARIHKVLV